jgi:hypothetical protein
MIGPKGALSKRWWLKGALKRKMIGLEGGRGLKYTLERR